MKFQALDESHIILVADEGLEVAVVHEGQDNIGNVLLDDHPQ